MGTGLTLTGARVAEGPDHTVRRDIHLPGRRRAEVIDLCGYLLLPGLINAHDHLEFALFPRLGHPPYGNASAWAADIHRPEESPVKEQRAVPRETRLLWGALRNLVCGVTTVAHHNPWEPIFDDPEFPVRVVKRFGWAHSLEFSRDITRKFRKTPSRWPFIIHAAEGIDEGARAEIPRLEAMGVLRGNTVLVHAVAVDEGGWRTIARRGASVIWCPTSNKFLFGRTIPPRRLRGPVPIALGTDSPLTSAGDMIDEMRAARKTGRLTAGEIYEMVTAGAARVLRLKPERADFVAVRDTGQSPAHALSRLKPEMVIVGGKIRLLAGRLATRYGDASFHPIDLKSRTVLIRARMP
jgi:cytosine/adenosine deaminase-related metal-dependent hydrolase